MLINLKLKLTEKQIRLLTILTRGFAEDEEVRKAFKDLDDLDQVSQIEANTLYAIMQTKANNLGIPTV
jgi:Ca2+-binding EF-hand superfamily protein